MEIFCFLLGLFYALTYHPMPLLGGISLYFIKPKLSLLAFFILGIVLSFVHQKIVQPRGFPEETASEVLAQGFIASIPLKNSYKSQFVFNINSLNGYKAQGLVLLSWFAKTPPLKVGQFWQFKIKLKKPHNYLNPGSLNYVNSLAAKHIYWTGTILANNNELLKDESPLSWLALREKLASNMLHLAPDDKTAGIIEALTLNLTNHINQEDWDLFRRTGTTHLFGISGEHIALITGLVTFIIRKLWALNRKACLWIPALQVGGVSGFIVACLYAFLAGFGPPVQRALMGSFFYTLYCLGKQRFTPWQIWRYALFAVLFLEPHVLFMQGFYFSFLAVSCLLITQQRWQLKYSPTGQNIIEELRTSNPSSAPREPSPHVWGEGKKEVVLWEGYKAKLALQLGCLLGLMPLSLYWFSYGSINGFITNLFAIPLVGLCIVPLSLILMLMSNFSFASLLIKPLTLLIALLYKLLIWTECLDGINIIWTVNRLFQVFSLMGALLIWALLPVKPFKYIALLWLLLSLFPAKRQINPGEALINVLDVGQGLAVFVETQNHTLLYDTGDQFFQGSDLGTMVILPFFKAMGINKLDKIVISHPDKDHKGGLKSIEKYMKVRTLLVNDLHFYDHGLNCHEYPLWKWDGVVFQFFPISEVFKDKNNNSCVLQIRTSTTKLLLAGDIEQEGEDYLVRNYGQQLSSEILIVPHHGSKTSSSYRFLLEVAPLYAIASLGLENRFHFPHAKTLANMKSLNIPFIRTDECGMVEFTLPARGALERPRCYKEHQIV